MMRSALALAIVSVALTLGLLAQPAEPALADYNLTRQWQISIGGGAPCPATITQQHTPTPSKYYSLTVVLTCGSSTNVFNGTIHGATGAFSATAVSPPAVAVMEGTASADNHTITGTYCVGLGGSGSCSISTRTLYGTGGDGLPKPTPSPTAVPSAGLAFSIGIDTNGDTVDDCQTRTGPTNCVLAVGTTFTLKAYVDSLPDAVAGYTGFDLWVSVVGVEWNGLADADVWPDCQAESIAPFVYQAVEWGCVVTSGASTTPESSGRHSSDVRRTAASHCDMVPIRHRTHTCGMSS